MRPANETMRRQDRLMNDDAALNLLRTAEYGVLSLQAEEGGGYGVPLHFAWDGGDSIVFHCAPEGRKLRCLTTCGRVSFCIVGGTQVIPSKFSTNYESVIVHGTAEVLTDATESIRALTALAVKYLPENPEACRKYAEALSRRTVALCLTIDTWTAKKCWVPH